METETLNCKTCNEVTDHEVITENTSYWYRCGNCSSRTRTGTWSNTYFLEYPRMYCRQCDERTSHRFADTPLTPDYLCQKCDTGRFDDHLEDIQPDDLERKTLRAKTPLLRRSR